MRTFRFELFGQGTPTPILRLFGPDGSQSSERPLAVADVDAFIGNVDARYKVASAALAELGQRLYDWLDGPTERWLSHVGDGTGGTAVHINVAGRLRHLPWELLCTGGAYLCCNVLRPFVIVRRAGKGRRGDTQPRNRPLRVLLMACSPEDVKPVLDYEKEEGLILKATERQPIELVAEESGSIEGLKQRVESFEAGYFDVFHLTGHAAVVDGKPLFVMENELGFVARADTGSIAKAFGSRWPRLVFLSGCETGKAADAGALPSLCEALVAAGAPAVLGWALPVGDWAASAAAAELYHLLATGVEVDEAVARAARNCTKTDRPTGTCCGCTPTPRRSNRRSRR